MADFKIPHIDDRVELDGRFQRVVGITTWEDCEEDGEQITVLTITLTKTPQFTVPQVFIDALRDRPLRDNPVQESN